MTYMLLLNCALKLVEEIIQHQIYLLSLCLLSFFIHLAVFPCISFSLSSSFLFVSHFLGKVNFK